MYLLPSHGHEQRRSTTYISPPSDNSNKLPTYVLALLATSAALLVLLLLGFLIYKFRPSKSKQSADHLVVLPTKPSSDAAFMDKKNVPGKADDEDAMVTLDKMPQSKQTLQLYAVPYTPDTPSIVISSPPPAYVSPPPPHSPPGLRSLPRVPSQRKGKVPPPLPPIQATLKPMSEPSPLTPPISPVRTFSVGPFYGSSQGLSKGHRHSGIRQSAVKLPRPMIVTTTFETDMDDELVIDHGETLIKLQEYEDEWCLVQRPGPNGRMGMIPCFCLSELPSGTASNQSSQ